jgi:hypothetical protein
MGGVWNTTKRGNNRRSGPQLCRFIKQGDHCWHGDNCTYSHDIPSDATPLGVLVAGSPEQLRDRGEYNTWKRLIKRPQCRMIP